MPYRDPEQRRLAARKWRQAHRPQRAAYMRRYRRSRRSGRSPGRPRAQDPRAVRDPFVAEIDRVAANEPARVPNNGASDRAMPAYSDATSDRGSVAPTDVADLPANPSAASCMPGPTSGTWF